MEAAEVQPVGPGALFRTAMLGGKGLRLRLRNLWTKAAAFRVRDHAVRMERNSDDVFLDRDGILKLALPVEELLKPRDLVVSDFALGLQLGVKDDIALFVAQRRDRPLTKRVYKIQYPARFPPRCLSSLVAMLASLPGQACCRRQALSGLASKRHRWQAGRMAAGKRWTRDELLVVLNLYHKLTFGQLHARHPAIVALAKRLGRGPSSVAMKLSNFASLDPALKLRGIRGLEGVSALDRQVWQEFHEHLEEAVPASEEGLRRLFGADESSEVEVLPKEGIRVRKRPPTGPTETPAQVKQRRGQEYFREAVLNNFGGRCGVTQLGIRELLVASHILPWGTHPQERLNLRNGLCLSRLHDAAFDQGLIAFDDHLRLLLSPQLKAALAEKAVADNFGAYAGQPLHLPADAVPPELRFLAEHRAKVFRKS